MVFLIILEILKYFVNFRGFGVIFVILKVSKFFVHFRDFVIILIIFEVLGVTMVIYKLRGIFFLSRGFGLFWSF